MTTTSDNPFDYNRKLYAVKPTDRSLAESSFGLWEKNVQGTLVSHDAYAALVELPPEHPEALALFLERDAAVINYLTRCTPSSPTLYHDILAKRGITAKSAFEEIRETRKSGTRNQITKFTNKLSTSKWDGENLRTYVDRFVHLGRKANRIAIDIGQHGLSEDTIAQLLIESIKNGPNCPNDLMSEVIGMKNNPDFSLTFVMSELKNTEYWIDEDDEQHQEAEHAKPLLYGSEEITRCPHCGSTGKHARYPETCWHKNRNRKRFSNVKVSHQKRRRLKGGFNKKRQHRFHKKEMANLLRILSAIKEQESSSSSSDSDDSGNESAEVTLYAESSSNSAYGLAAEMSIGNENYIFDSGAQCHVSNNREHFENLKPVRNEFLKTVDDTRIPIVGRGDIKIHCRLPRGKSRTLKVTNVCFVPDSKHNLLSVPQLTKLDTSVLFSERHAVLRDRKERPILMAKRSRGLYFVKT